MCDACREDSLHVRRFTRRAMLALGFTGLGAAAAALWSCRRQPGPAEGSPTASSSSKPATTSRPRAPAPDLGAEVFPDIHGRPIAKITDAPVIIIPRADWTDARPNLYDVDIMNGISCATVHHTAGELQTDAWDATADTLEAIRDFHTGTQPSDRHWADIAYHFVVDRAGRVWQARPLAYQGAHAHLHNEHNLGIVLLGDFEKQIPAAAQLTSLANFLAFVRALYGIPVAQIYTHRELVKTDCPGKNLQAYMDRARKKWALESPGQSTPIPGPTTLKPHTPPTPKPRTK